MSRNTNYNTPLAEEARKLKILLLEPLFPVKAAWGSVKSLQGHLAPLGVISIYNWLKNRGYNVEFLDTQFGDYTADSLREYLRVNKYDVVGISVYTPTADYAFASAKLAKEVLPACKVIMGNIHVSMLPELSMQQCPELDFIARNEGELVMDDFLCELAGGGGKWADIAGLVYRSGARVIINTQREFIEDLDTLPVGFYGDLDMRRYVPHLTQYVSLPSYSVMTQRGCPFSCTYCGAAKILGKKSRFFSPGRIVEELKILKYEKKAAGVYFQDSTFTINRPFVMDLMRRMIDADLGLIWACNTRADLVDPEMLALMYKAGGRQISIGVESGNQASLDLVKKGTTVEKQAQGVKWIREAGFRCVNNFIICLPGETEAMVKKTISFARQLKAPISIFWLPVPYPGTEIYEACKADGGLRAVDGWNDYLSLNFENPVYVNPNFGAEGMRYWHRRANLEYYLNPVIWWENIKTIRTRRDLAKLANGIVVFLELLYGKLFGKIRRFQV